MAETKWWRRAVRKARNGPFLVGQVPAKCGPQAKSRLLPGFVNKVLVLTQPNPCNYIFSVAAFHKQWQSLIATAETIGLAKTKRFTIRLFTDSLPTAVGPRGPG